LTFYYIFFSNIPRHPTLDSLINVLRQEEYDWYLKQKNLLRIPRKVTYSKLKRKTDEIAKDPKNPSLNEVSFPCVPKSPSSANKKAFSELKKQKFNDQPSFSPKSKVEFPKSNKKTSYSLNMVLDSQPWLVWEAYSCRLDCFFSIVIFTLLFDERLFTES